MSTNPDWNDILFRKRVLSALSADVRRGAARRLHRAGKYVVAASAGLYAVGFCICVLHYYRRGVPVQVLSHTHFLASGILFVVVTGSGFWFGLSSAAGGGRRGLARVGACATGLWAFAGTQTGYGAATVLAIYWTALAMLAFIPAVRALRRSTSASSATPDCARCDERCDHRRKPPAVGPDFTSSHTDMIVPLLGIVSAFTMAVYPLMPQWVGGGEPRAVTLFWSQPLTAAEQTALGFGESQPCTLEVYADSEQIYLMTSDPKDVRCSASQSLWRFPSLDAFARNRRFAVIPRDRLTSIVYR